MTTITTTTTMPVIKDIELGTMDDDITIQEDRTCYLITIEMPNVNGNDITISLKENILTISGYRRCYSTTTSTIDNHNNNYNNTNTNMYTNTYTNNRLIPPPPPSIPSISSSSSASSSLLLLSNSSSNDQQQQHQQLNQQQQQQQQQEEHIIRSASTGEIRCRPPPHHCASSSSTTTTTTITRTKRQRIHRRFEIDSTVIDIDRAIANTWNGCLTLYAPKRRVILLG